MTPIVTFSGIRSDDVLPTHPAIAPRQSSHAGAAPAAGVARDFEAAMLGPMMEAMLPSEDAAVWGSGRGGHMWRSLFAQELAAEIARSGGVGIAELVEGFVAERTGADT